MFRPAPTVARHLPLALLLGLMLLWAPANAAAAQRTGRLLVLVDKSAQGHKSTATLRRLDARRAGEQVPQVGLVTVRPGAGRTLAATAAALRRLPFVSSVTPERRYSLRLTPNDPALSEMLPGAPAGTPKQWWAARENLFGAWEITRGTGAKVAIIDSGVDGSHPEFAGKIALTRDNDARTSGPADVDEQGHGTHVASLACARGDNGLAIVGTGLNCELIVLKSDLSDASVAKSIVEATDLGADAINMSFGYEGNDLPPASLLAAIDYAVAHNVVLVAAAANVPVQNQGDPANLLQPTGTGPDITFNKGLTVTSANFKNLRSAGAGRGSQISLAAYGSYSSTVSPRGILGALPHNQTEIDTECTCRATIDGDGRYGYLTGTSMATPQVTGIAALVANLNPDLKAAAVVRLLKETATRPVGSGWQPDLGWGIVNAGAAVSTARLMDRRAPSSKARGPKRLHRQTIFTLKWTSRDTGPPGVVVSGIRRYYVYRSKDGGKYRKIATTSKTSRRIKTAHGARYRFYTIATDKRGNREKKPKRADVSLKVSPSR